MKVFVYRKKDNKTIAVFTGVVHVYYLQEGQRKLIRFVDGENNLIEYDRDVVKTRIYQN